MCNYKRKYKKCIIYLSILGDENRTQIREIGKEGGFHGHLMIELTENKGSEEKLLMNPDIIVIDRSRSYSTS